jgi:DNA polymerase-3 subunit epsilon
MTQQRIVFFDLETSGLDHERHEIIQIAAIAATMPGFEPVEEFECKVRFDILRAEAAALEGNSYDREVWDREAIDQGDAAKRFDEFMRRHSTMERVSKRTGKPFATCRMAGHNASTFDIKFLRKLYAGGWCQCDVFVYDTLQLAGWWASTQANPPANLQLGTLCNHLGIDLGDNAHDALADVRAAIEVARVLSMNAIHLQRAEQEDAALRYLLSQAVPHLDGYHALKTAILFRLHGSEALSMEFGP